MGRAKCAGELSQQLFELRGYYDHGISWEKIYRNVRDGAYDILRAERGYILQVAMAVMDHGKHYPCEHSVMPVSSYIDGPYGPGGCLSQRSRSS